MTKHISSVEAEAQDLPGHDTFRASHVTYYDDVNRDGGVFALCLEAFNAFNDSIMVSERHALGTTMANAHMTERRDRTKKS